LLNQLWRGGFTVGDKLPTISDIAVNYNVSRDTAIRAVNELVKTGVLESRRRVGIRVRSIPPKGDIKHKSILVIDRRGSVFFSGPLSDAIHESLPGWSIFQTRIDGSGSQNYSDEFLNCFIRDHPYEVYVLASVHQKLKDYFQRNKLSCVVVGELEDGIDLPNVCLDEYARYYQATRYLIRLGYPRIAFIQFKAKSPGDYQREAAVSSAYSETIVADAIKKPVVIEIEEHKKPDGERALAGFLAQTEFPVGVVSGSDAAACWLLQKALEMGIAVPEEVGIVTSGSTDLPTHTYPQISGLKADRTKLGFALGRMLMQITGGYEPEPRHVIIPYERPYLIPRQTTTEANFFAPL